MTREKVIGVKLNDIRDKNSANHNAIVLALYLGLLGGVVNFFVDLDHFLYFWGWKGIVFEGLAGRPLHFPLLVVAGCLGIYSISRLAGLDGKLVLKWAWKIVLFVLFLAVLVGLELLWAKYIYPI